MIYTYPDYYREFRCTADQCEDTCCAGWQIVADERTLRKYKKVKGPFRRRLLKFVNWKEKTFRQDSKRRCAFLNDHNLCDMYIALGEESLCRTCRLYPRHIEEFENVREITLSLSCPEVTKILLSKTEPVTFRTVEREGEDEYEDFDFFLYSLLADVREASMKILRDRSLSLDIRTGLIYGMSRDIQRRINQSQLFTCEEVIDKYQGFGARAYVESKIADNKKEQEKQYHFAREQFDHLFRLELLEESWYVTLKEAQLRLYAHQTPEQYAGTTQDFHTWLREQNIPWEIHKEQLTVYFLFTYLCGAVYDARLFSKTQLSILSPFLMEEILKSKWIKNGRILYEEDFQETIYRYSRELEHSDPNLKKFEHLMPRYHALFD